MAGQVRRGNYSGFDPTKFVPGEPSAVLDGDPNTSDGKAVYMSFGAGNVKRMVTFDEVSGLVNIAQQSAESAQEDAGISKDNAAKSQSYAVGGTGSRTGEDSDNSKYYKEQAETYAGYVEQTISALPPILSIDFSTGELLADGGLLILTINESSGNLEYFMAGGN